MSKQTAMNLYVNDSLRGEAKEISYYLEMEKQQIIQSNRDGTEMVIVDGTPFITGEQYFFETFNK